MSEAKNFIYTSTWAEEGAPAKVHQYQSAEYGAVVLILWPTGLLSIHRETKDGAMGTQLSAELIKQMDQFRFQSEVAIAEKPNEPS